MYKLFLFTLFILLINSESTKDYICGLTGNVLCDGESSYRLKCPQGYHINQGAFSYGMYCYKNSNNINLLPGTVCGGALDETDGEIYSKCNGHSPANSCPKNYTKHHWLGFGRSDRFVYCALDKQSDEYVEGLWCGYVTGISSYRTGRINWAINIYSPCHGHYPVKSCPRGYKRSTMKIEHTEYNRAYVATCHKL